MSGVVFRVHNFYVNSVGSSSKFHIVLEYFEDLKSLILNILKEPPGLFSLQDCKVFRIGQSK